jgi:hypothetical protein
MTETATLGIDLASQPKLTALCRIDWTPGRRGYAYCPALDQSDEDMLALMGRDDVTKVGIDAPFGWPAAFIEGLVDYRRAGLWPDAPGERVRQREMELRATDRFVHEMRVGSLCRAASHSHVWSTVAVGRRSVAPRTAGRSRCAHPRRRALSAPGQSSAKAAARCGTRAIRWRHPVWHST